MQKNGFVVSPDAHRPSTRHCADFRPEVADRLAELAQEAGVEVSEVIRQAVDQALGFRQEPTARQRKLGRWMARVLNVELPKGVLESRTALSSWIDRNKVAFERRVQAKGEGA